MCRVLFWGFAAAYLVALLLFATGTFGWFGQPRDPLAAVFLLPLGVPWVLAVDHVPEAFRLALGLASPLINLLLIGALCRWRARR